MNLNLKQKKDCAFDAVSLGEVMLRLDPGEGRIRTARSFRVWEGGGEYNVVRGLRRFFGLKTAVITAFADNEVESSPNSTSVVTPNTPASGTICAISGSPTLFSHFEIA